MKNIIYFSPINWFELKQRPQHIAEELSKQYKVTFIEPSISILSSIIQRDREYQGRFFSINKNLEVMRPSGVLRLPRCVEYYNLFKFNTLYERKQLQKYINKSHIIWLGSPIYYPIIENIKSEGKILIYDKMDDYVKLTRNQYLQKVIAKNEMKLLREADIIFVSSDYFYKQIVALNNSADNIFLVNNGLDKNCLLDTKSVTATNIKKLKKDGSIIFGYVGTIDHWFDYEVIREILRFNSKFKVVIVGKDNRREERIISKNIYYFDPVNKEEVFSVIQAFDYCLYPFKLDEFLQTINPVKIYEYLACNKWVIAAKSIETAKFTKNVLLYNSLKDFVGILHSLKDRFSKIGKFSKDDLEEFIYQNSWEQRVSYINQILIDYLAKD
ncbi:glycosyltransferase family protein [Parageobacillus thermoglucosidasius]|uniref:glycosyltransferase family protein n=1 Tax=Parageobacillus thermoglucosidasius TaxID=1426 RepID=UPI0001D16BB9|nr:group 1 glycosyl transferase [Parageobacillus thermoglucosidasius]AEH46344.1 glycosyl transferase group 1 [Parageobacillus thermoglucosidasius C56-YS93]